MKSFYEIFARKSFAISVLACLLGGFLYSVGLAFFITTLGAYAGGVNGISQVLAQFLSEYFSVNVPLGVFTIIINIPILIFGWFKVERRFTILSVGTVFWIGFLLSYFNNVTMPPISDELLINFVIGGLLMGVGIAFCLRYGGSTGGTDIILSYLSQRDGKSFGSYAMIMNVIVVLAAFALNPENMEGIMITIILFFYQNLIVNQIHTKHKRFTAFIITEDPTVISEQIHLRCGRGATKMKAEGTYERSNKYLLMTVISSYQLFILKDIVAQYDPAAFVNIVPTKDIYGNFISKKTEIPLN